MSTRCVILTALAAILCSGQNDHRRAADNSHAESHARDSYVLILNNQAIARGPDFSQRESALLYARQSRLRDLVWFSIAEGVFLATDAGSIRTLRAFEKAQKDLNKRRRRDSTNPGKAGDLRQEQNKHTMARDELVWSLFDKLKAEGRLANVKNTRPVLPDR